MNEPVSSPENPYAAPKAEVQDVAEIFAQESQLASRWRRLGGSLIDTFAISLLGGVLSVIGAMLMGMQLHDVVKSPSQELAISVAAYLSALVAWCVFVGYPTVTRGQSLGKIMLGMRIVRSDQSRASGGRLFLLRYAVPYAIMYLIPIIGWLFAIHNTLWIFGSARQCLHDKIADTIVIRV